MRRTELDIALDYVREYYEKAKDINRQNPGTIRDQPGWALYKAWNRMRERRERLENERKTRI